MWRTARSSQRRSDDENFSRGLKSNTRPAGRPLASSTVAAIRALAPNSLESESGGFGGREQSFPVRRSQPKPARASAKEFQAMVTSRQSSRKPSARTLG